MKWKIALIVSLLEENLVTLYALYFSAFEIEFTILQTRGIQALRGKEGALSRVICQKKQASFQYFRGSFFLQKAKTLNQMKNKIQNNQQILQLEAQATGKGWGNKYTPTTKYPERVSSGSYSLIRIDETDQVPSYAYRGTKCLWKNY